MMDTTIEKIKQMVDVNTIIGNPIACADGTTIIPISKVSYGFASGGSDFPSKKPDTELFGGGGGAGITISPVAFLVVREGNVRLLQINPVNTTVDRVVDMVPEVVDKISSLIKKDKKTPAKDEIDALAEELNQNWQVKTAPFAAYE